MPAYSAVQLLFPRALQHVIILEIPACRLQSIVFSFRSLPIRIVENVILQLGAGGGLVAHLRSPFDLAAQNCTRRLFDQFMRGGVQQIAGHKRSAVQPGRDAKSRQVGKHVNVTITSLPIRELVSRDGVHLHVGGEKIIAGMRSRLIIFQEKPRIQPLSERAAIEIGEGQQHRVDARFVDHGPKFVHGQHSVDLHRMPSTCGLCAEMEALGTGEVMKSQPG